VALLVHLDRVDTTVAIAVTTIRYRLGEAFIENLDAVVQQVANPQYGGHVQAALMHAAHNIHQADRYRLAVKVDLDLDFSAVGHVEVSRSPGIDAIKLRALGGIPAVPRVGWLPCMVRRGGHGASLVICAETCPGSISETTRNFHQAAIPLGMAHK
jgi:hypothetical protein